jgi:hypothetical protein
LELWLVAAFSLCPCHLPILLAIFRAGAIGGALARNQGVLFIALGALSAVCAVALFADIF